MQEDGSDGMFGRIGPSIFLCRFNSWDIWEANAKWPRKLSHSLREVFLIFKRFVAIEAIICALSRGRSKDKFLLSQEAPSQTIDWEGKS